MCGECDKGLQLYTADTSSGTWGCELGYWTGREIRQDLEMEERWDCTFLDDISQMRTDSVYLQIPTLHRYLPLGETDHFTETENDQE